MDSRKAARRKICHRASDLYQACTQVSDDLAAGLRMFSELFRPLLLLFLVPHHAETPVRIFGCECRPARRCAIPGGFRSDAGYRVAFRQEPRKILALRGAVSYRGSRTSGAHRSPWVHSVLAPAV